MNVLRSLSEIPVLKRSVVTIGVFDGVHRGHRAIIRRVVAEARRCRAASVVITFDPHPAGILHPSGRAPQRLMALDHRIRLLGSLGIDIVIVTPFSKAIAGLSPELFAERFLVRRLNAVQVIVGDGFRFGTRARGTITTLRRIGAKLGFLVLALPPVIAGSARISSSRIRSLIRHGALKAAGNLLGRPVSILGTVVYGRGFGRILGFPTANVDPHHEAIPPSGVYAVRVHWRERVYGGVLNIGRRPTFRGRWPQDREPVIEVHLFNFTRMIYGDVIEIEFIRHLRDEQPFPDQAALVRAIRRDSDRAGRILGRLQHHKGA